MKNKSIFGILTLALLSGGLIFTSCKKKDTPAPTPAPDTEQTSSTDNAYAENSANDIQNIGSQVSESGSLNTFKTTQTFNTGELLIAPCATISVVAKVITVDFGNTGCLGLDGRIRTGKLIYDFTASPNNVTAYRMPGFSFNVSSVNYVVDGYTINIANKTVKNTTPLSVSGQTAYTGTNLTWSVSANISIVKPANAGTISWTCNRTMTLTNSSNPNCYKGQLVPIDWTKAIIQVSGTANGTTAGNESYTSTATNMVKDFNCSPDPNHIHKHPFISGTLDFTPGQKLVRHIDFGPGTCDLNATVTINGTSYPFILP
jgi:hypothetical protein